MYDSCWHHSGHYGWNRKMLSDKFENLNFDKNKIEGTPVLKLAMVKRLKVKKNLLKNQNLSKNLSKICQKNRRKIVKKIVNKIRQKVHQKNSTKNSSKRFVKN